MISINILKNEYPMKKKKIFISNSCFISLTLENEQQIHSLLQLIYNNVFLNDLNFVRIKDVYSNIELYKTYFNETKFNVIENKRTTHYPELVAYNVSKSEVTNIFDNWGFYEGGIELYFAKAEKRNEFIENITNINSSMNDIDIFECLNKEYIYCIMKQVLDNTIEIVINMNFMSSLEKIFSDIYSIILN